MRITPERRVPQKLVDAGAVTKPARIRMISKLHFRFALPGLIAVLLLGCSHSAADSSLRDQALVTSLGGDPKTFNPLLAQETSSTQVTQFLFDGLTRLNPVTGEIEAGLAESWESSNDGLVWTFHLPAGLRWSDGQPLTAGDVLFTFNTLIYNQTLMIPARDIFMLQGSEIQIESPDETTVIFRLPVRFAPFLTAMSQPIMPRHILEREVEAGSFASSWSTDVSPDAIVGSGPYRLRSYRPGERIVLERNSFYRRRDESGQALPYIDSVVMLILPNPDTRLLKFLQGELDDFTVVGKDFPVLQKESVRRGFSLYRTGPGFGSNFLVFNQKSEDPVLQEWFSSEDFRRAAAMGMDRTNMINLVYNRLAEKQCSPVSPSNPVYFYAEAPCFGYDPARAQALLEQKGFVRSSQDGFLYDREGRKVRFVLMTNAENAERVQLAQMIREDFSRLGMDVSLLALEFNAMVVKLLTGKDWDAVLLGLTGSVDPHFGANVWRSDGSLHFWETPEQAKASAAQQEIDRIFDEASQTVRTARRKQLYDQWQKLVAENAPHIYTVLPEIIYAVNNRIENVRPTALGGIYYNIEELKIRSNS